LTNGDKGAEVHTVSESDRIRFTRMLMEFREQPDDDVDETGTTPSIRKLELPATLTNTERKFIHQLAGQLGVVIKSTGKGEIRRICISKRKEGAKRTTNDDDDMPILSR
jgi:predicted RNA-binding protein Jag